MGFKNTIKKSAPLVLAFSVGIFAGPPLFGPPMPMGPGHLPARELLTRFEHDVRLDQSEREQALRIFEEQRNKVLALHHEVFPRFNAIREETRLMLREIISPEKRGDFDKLHQARELHKPPEPPAEYLDNNSQS